MLKKYSPVKKLAFYFAIAVMVFAINKEATAQIVYAPVITYFTRYDTSYLLDLNSERIMDFNVKPDPVIYRGLDSTIQFLTPIIMQHEDSLIAKPGKNGKFLPKVTFQWYNKYATPISGADSSYYLPNTSGYYYVAVTDSSEAISMLSEVFQFVLTDITTLNSTDDISVTESNSLIKIKFIDEPYYGYQLAIYNYSGQKVFSYEIDSVSTFANLRPLAKGLYFVSVEKGDRRIVKKFIIV